MRVTRESLEQALASAGAAHHEFEQKALHGVRDEQWPGWYAAYVLGRLGDFVPPSLLARWLEAVQAKEGWSQVAAAHVMREIERGAR